MYPNYIKNLLNLEDIIIKKIKNNDFSISFFIETKPKPHTCPCCGATTIRIHDYRQQRIKDLPFQLKDCYLILKKRRYLCSCGKKFYEKYSFLSKYQQRTIRLSYGILNELRDTVSIKYVASKTNVSSSTVCRLIDTLNYTIPTLSKAISIDEFKGNANTGKYQCILVEPTKRKVLDILPDRTQSHLCNYFRDISKKERHQVKFFVCDMWQPYVDIAKAYFPNAEIIIDKYHFIRQISWAIDRIRKRLQRTMPASLRKYYKRSKQLIHARYNTLNNDNKKRCDLMLIYNDDLRKAHYLKEWFYDICKEKKYSIVRRDFKDWVSQSETCGIREFEEVAATYRRWSQGILNAFKYGLTNGPTEGYNNKIKVLKRNSYGITNFDRFRTRILHCTQ
jgi:transposase